MRSVILGSLVGLSLFAVVACSGGSNGSGTSSALPAPDAGASAVKPVKVPAPVTRLDAGTAAPDAGDVMPDPTPGLVPTCKGAALCVQDCADNDDACYQACMKDMPDEEFAKFEALGTCVNQSGCETDACVNETCAGEINACLGE